MARVPRKSVVSRKGGFFSIVNRIADYIGEYPLQRPEVTREFIRRLKYALARSCIHCPEFCLMGNHFHLVLFVEEFRVLSRCKLERLARARWGKRWKLHTRFWSDKRWEKFNQEVFDLVPWGQAPIPLLNSFQGSVFLRDATLCFQDLHFGREKVRVIPHELASPEIGIRGPLACELPEKVPPKRIIHTLSAAHRRTFAAWFGAPHNGLVGQP